MFRTTWPRARDSSRHGREATLAQIIETIDLTAPATKSDLAGEVDISEQYLSELLQELKRDGIVRKGYIIDEDALQSDVEMVSQLLHTGDETLEARRSHDLLDLLERLNDVTLSQYRAAWQTFAGEDPDDPADQFEGLANERHMAIFEELKSYTLATEWPGNRVASDLATIATNLEIVGDRACFIEDIVDEQDLRASGAVEERVLDIFEAGEHINAYMTDILLDGGLSRYEDLQTEEETLHRDLNELFELVTAYDPEMYGYLVTVSRALERAIFYWVHTAELAVRLHSGQQPEHIEMSRPQI
jgi:phosphate transport system protein